MFTGIIEATGRISGVATLRGNSSFLVESPLATALKVDESVSHNGVCLTVEKITGSTYQVTAIEETLQKTNASFWKEGDMLNLERSLQLSSRLDGHIVQGHVDGTVKCIARNAREGSVEFTFAFDSKNAHLIIEKGSVCLNGISLTAFGVSDQQFTVAIIPYTLEHTNARNITPGDILNIEYDVLGKYIARLAGTGKIPLPGSGHL